MAESLTFGRSIDLGSDNVPEHYCEPCYEAQDDIKPVAGYCQNCNENLCFDCYTRHLRRKIFQNHKLVDKSTKPKTKSGTLQKPQSIDEACLVHHGETIHSFCHGHSQLCCKICLTIDHQVCKTEKISKLAQNIQASHELQNLTTTLRTLKNGFDDNLTKTGANESVIQNNHINAMQEMEKLQNQFDKLMSETELRAEKVKEEDFKKIEKVAATCDIVIKQINKLSTNLDTLKEKGETERLFMSMKRAEGQLKSLEGNLDKINKENTVNGYKFMPDERLKILFNDLEVLGQCLFEMSGNAPVSQQVKASRPPDQSAKRPTHLKDITVTFQTDQIFELCGSVVLPNKQILITDWQNKKLKLIDTNQDKILSELQVSGCPYGITKVKDNEFAVTVDGQPHKIQFVSVANKSLSKGREITVKDKYWGIAYNVKDQTLIGTGPFNGKVEILNMDGTVIKCLDKDSKGNKLFSNSKYVALSPDMTEIYITDSKKHSVTLMTMNGNVKAVYKDNSLKDPHGICVHKSGLVYVVGYGSHTVHQLDPDSGKLKLLLEQKDGLDHPMSISYCDLDDNMYIGMYFKSTLKVFQMK